MSETPITISVGRTALSQNVPGALSSSIAAPSFLSTVPPAPQQAPGAAKRERAYGLIPATAGSTHTMITREAPKVRVTASDLARMRAAHRTASAKVASAQARLAEVITRDPTQTGEEYRAAVLAGRDATDAAAAILRQIAEGEAALSNRPRRIVQCVVREPAEVAHELATQGARYVCLHEGCRGESYEDEAALRRAHPTDTEMRRTQSTHVFVLLSDAPVFAEDPDGEKIGYVAPRGSDGTTVAAAVARAEEPTVATADEVSELRAQVASLTAMMAEMSGEAKKS